MKSLYVIAVLACLASIAGCASKARVDALEATVVAMDGHVRPALVAAKTANVRQDGAIDAVENRLKPIEKKVIDLGNPFDQLVTDFNDYRKVNPAPQVAAKEAQAAAQAAAAEAAATTARLQAVEEAAAAAAEAQAAAQAAAAEAEDEDEEEGQDDNAGASSSAAMGQLVDRLNGRLLTEQARAGEVIDFHENLVLVEYDEVDEIIEQLRLLEFEEVLSSGRTVVRIGVIEGRDTIVLLTIRRRLKPYAESLGQGFSDLYKEGVAIYFGTLADGEDRRTAEATVMAWLRRLSGGDKGLALSTPAQQAPAGGAYENTPRWNSNPSSPYSRSNYPNGFRVKSKP